MSYTHTIVCDHCKKSEPIKEVSPAYFPANWAQLSIELERSENAPNFYHVCSMACALALPVSRNYSHPVSSCELRFKPSFGAVR